MENGFQQFVAFTNHSIPNTQTRGFKMIPQINPKTTIFKEFRFFISFTTNDGEETIWVIDRKANIRVPTALKIFMLPKDSHLKEENTRWPKGTVIYSIEGEDEMIQQTADEFFKTIQNGYDNYYLDNN